jgi:dipeptidyl aminopeptidase/acylaminoacyl peptidase
MTSIKANDFNEISYSCSIDNSMQKAMWYAPADQSNGVPLLVGLHTWGGDYKQKTGNNYYNEVKRRDWAFIFPDFRGPNQTQDAMGSDKTVQDIVDAIRYAQEHAKINPNRIYLCGASGGGFMAMLMAGRHPEIWAGVSAWCGISDIKAWHTYTKQNKSDYCKQIEKALGGNPDTDKNAMTQALRRSPISWLKNAEKLPLDIYHGANDKVVPSSESKNAFAVIAGKQIPKDAKYPTTIGKYKILSRKTFNNTRLSIFDSGHTILYPVAIEWLASQHKNKLTVWNQVSMVVEGSEIER